MVTVAGPLLIWDWLLVLASVPEPRFPVSLIACGMSDARGQTGAAKAQEIPSLGETGGACALAMSSLECTAPDVI